MKIKGLECAILATCLLAVTGESQGYQPSDSQMQNFTMIMLEDVPGQIFELDPCKTTNTSGVFKVQLLNQNVYCEIANFSGAEGGWLVIQQRSYNGPVKESFRRNWTDYRAGFGTVGSESEFWLGLEVMHQITTNGEYELVVELKDRDGSSYVFARYSDFHVAGEDDKYSLSVSGYSGTAGDGLGEVNGMRFTTKDSDNDNYEENCAKDVWQGGWWYDACGNSILNAYTPYWTSWGRYYSRMMIHRK